MERPFKAKAKAKASLWIVAAATLALAGCASEHRTTYAQRVAADQSEVH